MKAGTKRLSELNGSFKRLTSGRKKSKYKKTEKAMRTGENTLILSDAEKKNCWGSGSWDSKFIALYILSIVRHGDNEMGGDGGKMTEK